MFHGPILGRDGNEPLVGYGWPKADSTEARPAFTCSIVDASGLAAVSLGKIAAVTGLAVVAWAPVAGLAMHFTN